MIPKPFDVHELRAAIARIAGEEIDSIPTRSTAALPCEEVCRLLRLALAEEGESEEPGKKRNR
jgi:hypothetical protein